MTWSEAASIAPEQMADILFFDWWVMNEDRSLSRLGGNPNLLLRPSASGRPTVVPYDLNLAFDPEFDFERFRSVHVFAGLLTQWPLGNPAQALERALSASAKLPQILAALPQEWKHLDGDLTQPAQLSESEVRGTLDRILVAEVELWQPQ